MLRQTLKYHPFFIRLTNWEYWPAWITYFPVIFFWLYQSVRARDLLFFSALNPSIKTGGLFGESKRKVNRLIPAHLLPQTVYLPGKQEMNAVERQMRAAGMQFPVILKPDIGERGFNVALINNSAQLTDYLSKATGKVILQEYVDYPLELSIICYTFPVSNESGITSVCKKGFLTIEGDGHTDLRTLIRQTPRARLQWKTLRKRSDLDSVPLKGQQVRLEPIGNHCRGTKFLNANHLIDDRLTAQMVSILKAMHGVQFGRFDLRARSIEDLRNGKHFRILEFNGAGSEPAHIYDPSYPVTRAYRDLWNQWALMRRIAVEQRARGIETMTLKATIRALRAHFAYKKAARLVLDHNS